MNNTRRKVLAKIAEQIDTLKEELDGLKCDEEQAFENLPESLQYGEKGERMQEIIDLLEQAIDSLQEAIDGIEEAQQ